MLSNHYFRLSRINIFKLFILLQITLTNCGSKTHKLSEAKVIELKNYHSIVSFGDNKLANPTILKYGGNNHLFVYDAKKYQVLELNSSGEIVNKYGRQGRGPGEFLRINSINIIDNYLYVIDQIQFRIYRFALNGSLNSTLNFGKTDRQALPPPPQALVPRAEDINNQPSVTLNGNVLLSTDHTNPNFNSLYKLVNWKGNKISNIGDIPKGSAFMLNYDKYEAAIADQKMPAYYNTNAFPINDYANAGEFYFIYSALLKLAKYGTAGKKRWETAIPKTTELDSLTTYFFEVSQKKRNQNRIAFKTYVSGVSSKNGHLYLALGKYRNSSNGLWIHKFNTEGKLIRRYKLISKDVELVPVFDIDFTENRIFVVTESAEIRAYSF